MQFKNTICSIAFVIVICVCSCLAYAADGAVKIGESIQLAVGITTVFEETYTLNKSNEEVTKELLDADNLYNFITSAIIYPQTERFLNCRSNNED